MQFEVGTFTVRAYEYAAEVNGVESVALRVPNVVVVPLNMSVTVIVFLTIVGVPKVKFAVPCAEPLPVVAVAVLVSLL